MPKTPTTLPTATHSSSAAGGTEATWSAASRLFFVWLLFFGGGVFIDLQTNVTLSLKSGRGTHERAHCLGDAALAPDNLAQIMRAYAQSYHRGEAIIADLANFYGAGIIYQVTCQKLY